MPLWVWHVARAIAIAVALAFTVELVRGSDDALRIFWGAVIPTLPAVFLVAPGLWRNVCPLAASNQTPRYLKFTRALTLPRSFFGVAQPLGMGLFIAAVASREPLFNDSGVATGALLGGSLLAALVGGTLFKGKSGWCSSLCPLLPVQRVYGQTPFATVPNSHCRPCVGCTHNCYDFNPRVAFLADLYEDDRHWSGLRKLFTGALPGVVFAYFLLPEPSTIGTGEYYARFALVVGASCRELLRARDARAGHGEHAHRALRRDCDRRLLLLRGPDPGGHHRRLRARRRGVGAAGGRARARADLAGSHLGEGAGIRQADPRGVARNHGARDRARGPGRGGRAGQDPRGARAGARGPLRRRRPAHPGPARCVVAGGGRERGSGDRGRLPPRGLRRGPGSRARGDGQPVAGRRRGEGDARAPGSGSGYANGVLRAGARPGAGVAQAAARNG